MSRITGGRSFRIWLPAVYPFLDEIYLVYFSVAWIMAYLEWVIYSSECRQQQIEIELDELSNTSVRDMQTSAKTPIHRMKHVFFCLLAPATIATFAFMQPFRYHGTIRYTRLGCGQFLGPNGEIGGFGCT